MKPRQPAFERCQIRRKRQMRNEKEFPVRFASKRAVFLWISRAFQPAKIVPARGRKEARRPRGRKGALLWQDIISSPPSP